MVGYIQARAETLSGLIHFSEATPLIYCINKLAAVNARTSPIKLVIGDILAFFFVVNKSRNG
jgi:hypothetical protein